MLFRGKIGGRSEQTFPSVTEELVVKHKENNDYDGFREESMRTLGIDPDLEPGSIHQC